MVHHSNNYIVRVAVPQAVPTVLDYAYPLDEAPVIGSFVMVEVGKKKVVGLVVETPSTSPFTKLKMADILLDVPPLEPEMIKFYRWVTKYTMALPGDVLRAGLVSSAIPERVGLDQCLVPTGIMPKRVTEARTKVLDVLNAATFNSHTTQTMTALAETAGASPSVVKSLISANCIKWEDVPEGVPSININLAELSEDQANAAAKLSAKWYQHKFGVFLLDGMTGSGKTEVYFDTIATILENGNDDKSVRNSADACILVLVPEISLTPQLIQRFEKRFGFTPVLWHSGITEKQRRKAWWQVKDGSARVVIGARSSLFLPYKNLQFVVVDEEHDDSYKQEEIFRYHGRDMAITLAHHWKCPIVLCSATPSAETWKNMKTGRYELLHLQSRYGNAQLPEIEMVDMRFNKPKEKDHWLSYTVQAEIKDRLEKGEQSLIFLNRRGVAPLLICGGCGERTGCPSCDATLVVHRSYLICHHCGFHEEIPKACPACGAEKLRAFGPGTRKIKDEVERLFPDAKIAVADTDSVKSDKDMGDIVSRMQEKDVDILIGTQMVAKGHHFPDLTLVAIIDGDMGLARGELRTAERTFQLLTQVAGRAGRSEKAGKVMIQSHDVDNQLFKDILNADRDGFLYRELTSRKQWGDPPYSRQIALIINGKDERLVKQAARILATDFKEQDGVSLLGPAPASLAKLRDRYRYRLLVKGEKALQETVQKWLQTTQIPTGVRVIVDVDPVSFY